MAKARNFTNAREIIDVWLAAVQGKNKAELLPSQLLGFKNVWQEEHIKHCLEIPIIADDKQYNEFKKQASNILKEYKKIATHLGITEGTEAESGNAKLIVQIAWTKEKYADDTQFKEFVALICDTLYLHYCFVNVTKKKIKKEIQSIYNFFFDDKVELDELKCGVDNTALMNPGTNYNMTRWISTYFYAALASYLAKEDKKDKKEIATALDENLKHIFKVENEKDNRIYNSRLNIFLSIRYPEKFITIHAEDHKKMIVEEFSYLLNEQQKNDDIDAKIKSISDALIKTVGSYELLNYNGEEWVDFYGKKLRHRWDNAKKQKNSHQQREKLIDIDIANTEEKFAEYQHFSAMEGGKTTSEITITIRDSKFLRGIKEKRGSSCEACKFHYEDSIVEGHHLTPLATRIIETETTEDDIIILCPNCHSIAHYLLRTDEKDGYEERGKLLEELKEIYHEISNEIEEKNSL
ncbi:MAG: HNH endonuclease [Alphaproteobacteria bacterium]|nr:HNH endonuclease [Alphaproteobacteria bacterium]